MEKVAQILRQVREQRGLSLEEVAQRTRISLVYLSLLEGKFTDNKGQARLLADPLYLIPHLRTYADFLDIDPNFAVTQFTEELQATQGKSVKITETAQPAPLLSSPPQRSRAISISIVLVSVLVTLALIGQYSDRQVRNPESVNDRILTSAEAPFGSMPQTPTLLPPSDTTPPIPNTQQRTPPPAPLTTQPPLPVSSGAAQHPALSLDTPASSPSQTAQTEKTTPPPPQPEASSPLVTALAQQSARNSSHLLRIHAKEATWIRVSAEGQTKEMILQPGQSANWSSESVFELTIGNAGGVTLNFDGQDLPPLGRSGQVIRNMHLPFPPTEGQG
jgi:cytoskeleton protein RodZ